MEDLESLSNEEIRRMMMELGMPTTPVIPSTRRVILKKIQRRLELDGSMLNEEEPKRSSRTKSPGRGSAKSQSPGRQAKSHSPARQPPSPVRSRPSPVASSTMLEPEVTFRPTRSHSPVKQQSPRPRQPSPPRPRLSMQPTADSTMFDTEPFRGKSSIEVLEEETNAARRLLQELRASPTSRTDSPFRDQFTSPYNRKPTPTRISARAGLTTSRFKDDIKESDDEDSPTTPVYAKFSQGPSKGYSITHSRGHPNISGEKWFSIDFSVSSILLTVLLAFFILLGITYTNMHAEVGVQVGSDLEFPVCGGEGAHGDCILPRDQRMTMRIFKVFYSALESHLLSLPCSSLMSSIYFLNSEITQIILNNDNKLSIHDVELNLKNVKVLLEHNRRLNVETDVNGFLFTKPPLTFFCSLFVKLYFVATLLFKVALVFLVLFIGYLSVRWWFRRQAIHKEEVNKLAMQIIDLVSSACQGPNGVVPIDHVRDQLLSLEDRKKDTKLWPDAVELLKGDSRLRTEVQTFEGENFEVWRWLASSSSPSGKRKTWQGQAFDTIEGSMNALPDSPTPCLKIRHMFDAEQEEGDDWVTTVVDAILEKCGKSKVLHVVVDRQSREGCVYIKCASALDAGIAYRALHGSWFDGKLITVKYIREKRYLERFPDSMSCTHPLRPSS